MSGGSVAWHTLGKDKGWWRRRVGMAREKGWQGERSRLRRRGVFFFFGARSSVLCFCGCTLRYWSFSSFMNSCVVEEVSAMKVCTQKRMVSGMPIAQERASSMSRGRLIKPARRGIPGGGG